MIPYIIAFIVSIFTFHEGIVVLRHSRKHLMSMLLIVVSALPPIYLAAARSTKIGADVEFYVEPIFSQIQGESNIHSILEMSFIEPLYLLLTYIATLISHNIWSILFLSNLFVIVPIYISIIKSRKYINPTYSLFIFYCIYYNHSLNMIRQSIAVALVLLSVVYLMHNKKNKALLLNVFALGFHLSAILGFVVFFVFMFAHKYPLQRYKLSYSALIMAFALLSFFMSDIIIAVVENGYINEKYLLYTSQSDVFEGRLSYSVLAVKLITLLVLFYAFVKVRNGNIKLMSFFLLCGIINVLFGLSGAIIVYLTRTSYYFEIISILSIPYCLCRYNVRKNFKAIRFGYAIFLVFYWWFAFVYAGEAQTMPYEFFNK